MLYHVKTYYTESVAEKLGPDKYRHFLFRLYKCQNFYQPIAKNWLLLHGTVVWAHVIAVMLATDGAID